MDLRHGGLSPTGCGSLGGWHVIATEHQAEDMVAAHMRCLSWEPQPLIPLVRVLVPQPNRPAIRQTLKAFPGYVLALWREEDPWQRLLALRGVASVLHEVGARDRPARLPTPVVDALLARLSPEGILRQDSDPEAAPPAPILPGALVRAPVLPGAEWSGVCDWSSDRRVSFLLGHLRVTARRERVTAA